MKITVDLLKWIMIVFYKAIFNIYSAPLVSYLWPQAIGVEIWCNRWWNGGLDWVLATGGSGPHQKVNTYDCMGNTYIYTT